MLMPSPYLRYEYGEPFMNVLVPPSCLAEISKATNSRLSVHIVWMQNAPGSPGGATFFATWESLSPIANACGSNDSRATIGKLPVTTYVGCMFASIWSLAG